MNNNKSEVIKFLLKLLGGFIGGFMIAYPLNHAISIFSNFKLMGGNYNGEFERLIDTMLPFWLDTDPINLIFTAFAFLGVVYFVFWYFDSNSDRKRKKKIKGSEYGSAKWATKKDMQDFKAKNFEDNFLLSENAAISIPAIKKTKFQKMFGGGVSDRNKHILIIGGSGSGKTFNEVGPNLLQSNCSFISTDPKGDTVKKYGNWLKENGYKIKIINIKDTESFPFSFKYNPFHYIQDQASIMNLVSIIIENTSGSDDSQAKEDFWIKSERCLYMCLIAYLFYRYKDEPEEQTIPNMLDYISLASASEQNEDAVSPLDVIMEWWKDELIKRYGSEEEAQRNPEWFVLTQYDGFKKAAGETAKSIIISCFVRLSPFAIGTVRDMFSADELELEKIGEEKTALFMVMSDTNKTFNFILAMIFYQLFDINVKCADASPGSHCKIPIMCILDEMANIGRIPDLEIKIATLRSRWINLVPILQSITQLDALYGKEKAAIIKSNCDTFVYLGRGDYATCKEISEQLGKETIEVSSTSKSKQGVSTSTQKIARDLLSPDEIYANPDRFADDECLVMIKLARPFKDKKFMLFNHPRYKEFEKMELMDIEDFTTQFRADRWREEQRRAKQEMMLSEEDMILWQEFADFYGNFINIEIKENDNFYVLNTA